MEGGRNNAALLKECSMIQSMLLEKTTPKKESKSDFTSAFYVLDF